MFVGQAWRCLLIYLVIYLLTVGQERRVLGVLIGDLGNSELVQINCFKLMENQRLCTIAYEEFQTLNDLNLNFIKNVFQSFPNQTHRKYNLYVHSRNTVKFGEKKLKMIRGPHKELIV